MINYKACIFDKKIKPNKKYKSKLSPKYNAEDPIMAGLWTKKNGNQIPHDVVRNGVLDR